MKVLFVGFNLYGQFPYNNNRIVQSFIDLNFKEIEQIELSYSFTAIRIGNTVNIYGGNNHKKYEIQNIPFQETQKISQISCMDTRILYLTESGDIFKAEIDDFTKLSQLPKFEGLENDDKIIKIAAGAKITIAASESGKFFNAPSVLDFECQNYKDFCVGREHCLILDQEGNVHSFGRGSRGQLGHGSLDDELEPKLVRALAGIKISRIACGGWHSCALSISGDLYTWGWNSNGQLGLNNDDTSESNVSVMATPHVVDFSDPTPTKVLDINAVKVACGSRHTIVLLENNKLYGSGWNKYHQLGDKENENFYQMQFVKDLEGYEVVDLKCGPWSSAVITK